MLQTKCRCYLSVEDKPLRRLPDLKNPRQQSGQIQVGHIYKAIGNLRREGNKMTMCWLPTSEENELMKLAKENAKAATRQGTTPQTETPNMQSTTLNRARREHGNTRGLPKTLESNPREWTPRYRANTRVSCTTDSHGKRRACSLNSGQAWADSTHTYTGSKQRRQTNVHATRQEKR
jgi:hypothetical protein